MEGRPSGPHGAGRLAQSAAPRSHRGGGVRAGRRDQHPPQGMTPGRIAAAMVMLGWIFLALAFLTSCVSIPVPPFGDRVGEMGNLQLSVSVKYMPVQNPDLPKDDNLSYAWSKFGEAKALKDK